MAEGFKSCAHRFLRAHRGRDLASIGLEEIDDLSSGTHAEGAAGKMPSPRPLGRGPGGGGC